MKNYILVAVVVSSLTLLGLAGCPKYFVYQARMDGEASLAKSLSERKVQIQDAEGKLQAAKYLADAEIERARGVAEANKIIGSSLKNNEDYLRYLWIHNLNDAQKSGAEVIYVPTEANLPILEATRNLKK